MRVVSSGMRKIDLRIPLDTIVMFIVLDNALCVLSKS